MSDQPTNGSVSNDAEESPMLDLSESAASTRPKSRSGEPVLELRHLHRFFGKLKAVNDVSFKAYPGQVLGYIGPNGAGKTTSMRIIATLDTPTAGDAFVCGHSVIDDPDKVRRVLGFMPDHFGKYQNMNVIEYLDFFASLRSTRSQAAQLAGERAGLHRTAQARRETDRHALEGTIATTRPGPMSDSRSASADPRRAGRRT